MVRAKKLSQELERMIKPLPCLEVSVWVRCDRAGYSQKEKAVKRFLLFAVFVLFLSFGAPQAEALSMHHQPPTPLQPLAVSPQSATYNVYLSDPSANDHCKAVTLTGTYTAVLVLAGDHLWVTPVYPRLYSVCLHDIPLQPATYHESVTFSAGAQSAIFSVVIVVHP